MTSSELTRPTRRAKPAKPATGPCAFVWGFNGSGGLGTGHSTTVAVPIPTRLPAGAVAISTGADYALAVTSSGQVWAWGGNDYGQLGDGTTSPRLRPVQVKLPGGVRIASVVAAVYHSVAVSTSGQVFAWGRNHFGQLGDGTRTDRRAPVRIAVPAIVTQVGTARDHSVARCSNGTAFAWGINNAGQLGDGTTTSRLSPVRVQLPSGIKLSTVDAGNDHTLALSTTGRVVAWGNEIVAGVGTGASKSKSTEPTTKPVVLDPTLFGRSTVVAIDAGDNHAAALTGDGRVWTWGRNSQGQLGDGTTTDRRAPAVVKIAGGIRSLSSAGDVLLAQAANGDIYAWGANAFGQLGDGTRKGRGTPKRIESVRGAAVTAISAGPNSGVALVERGPLIGLALHPGTATVKPNEKQTYTVRGRDAFGNDLGPFTGRVTLKIEDGSVAGLTCWSGKPGAHLVTATSGTIVGRAVLTVTAPPPPPHRRLIRRHHRTRLTR